ncbi:MAG: hypothetical protein GX964_08505, partial [Syntrophomonadaceae bacterium]|nr:hypothetical protein [Syntrophomonadaceae bacterium]
FDQISLKDNAGKIVSVELKCSDRTLTIKPQDNLKKGTRYSVTVPPGAVRSPVGDPFTGTYTLTFTTIADGPHSVDFKVGQNVVIVDGQERSIDVSPVYRDNHVFASIRPVAEALDLDPGWDDAASTIVFVRGNTVVEWPMGYTAILVNGQAVETGVSPIMESDRVFVPIKYVAEAFGYEVSEDPGGVRLRLGEIPQDDPGKPEEPAKTSSGGGSPAPTGPLLEESIRTGATTIAQISGKVKVEIPDKAIEGKDSKLVIDSVSESKMARAGLSTLSPALEIAVENGQIVGKIAVTMNFNRNQLKSEEKAAIFYYDEKAREWMQLEGTLNDTRDAITVEVDHPVMLAVFAVVEETDTVKSEAPVPAPVSTQLKDLQGHWAVSDVMQLAQMGAVCGYPDETFKPDKNITRAEVMAILTSALDYEDSSDVSILHATFADVDDIPAWAGEAVAVGVKQGMISGYPQADGTMIFGANRPISRIELVTIIGRILADEMGSDDLTQSEFKDNSDIPVWGRNAVNSVVVKGVIKGYPDNTFRARNQVTRAEAAAMIMRLMEHK